METAERPKLAAALLRIALLLGGTVLFYWQLRHPAIRFAWGPLNDSSFLVALLLPWLALVQCLVLQRWWSILIAALGALPVLFFTFLALLGAMFASGPSAVDIIADVAWHGSAIRLYRIGGGATASDIVLVRQEMSILPGVKLVRNIDDLDDGSFEAAPTPDGVEVWRMSGAQRSFHHRPYRLKRFVYF
jgi:hypothetical protein